MKAEFQNGNGTDFHRGGISAGSRRRNLLSSCVREVNFLVVEFGLIEGEYTLHP
jgi:hypothetical protein